jgi:hydrogenase expression/formation protein HypE
MSEKDLPELGKISPEIFEELIYPRLGAASEDVLVGPQSGIDVGIIRVGDQAMAITTDPVFIVPQYGWERAAWFAIHILMSDAVTSGLPLRYLAIDLNLPVDMPKHALETVWSVIDRECKKYGVNIVSGHTARYEGCNYPMVGGASVIAVGPVDSYVSPHLARPGDHVIITKGPAIETTGLFVAALPHLIEEMLGAEFRERAERIFWQMSVVEDARIAVAQGVRDKGVTCMHDATECGIYGALFEVAHASGLGIRVDRDAIVVQPETVTLCRAFGIDPFVCISEGTLVITCRPHTSTGIVEALQVAGIPASLVGEMLGEGEGITIIEEGTERPLEHPKVDPFWAAFGKAIAEHG